jgi:hypothetical protein
MDIPPRCPVPACPVAWAKGPDRLRPEHGAEDFDAFTAAEALLGEIAPAGARADAGRVRDTLCLWPMTGVSA